jgi:hypothetical protein
MVSPDRVVVVVGRAILYQLGAPRVGDPYVLAFVAMQHALARAPTEEGDEG